jgi:hypothetical protein
LQNTSACKTDVKKNFVEELILLISEYSLNRVRVLLGNKDNSKFKNIA